MSQKSPQNEKRPARSDVSLVVSTPFAYNLDMYRKIGNSERLSHEVADHITMLIQDGQLKPGDRLPSELELTQLFGLSRPTIREAIRFLVSRNVLKVVRGRGTFVTENPGVETDPLGLNALALEELQPSLVEARLMIEPGVARLAAENAGAEDIEAIETHLADMEQIVHEGKVSMSIELEFHRSIARASKNAVIMRIIPIIMDSIIRTYAITGRSSHDHSQALEEHRHVFNAIRRGDPVGAEQAMRTHLEQSRTRSRAKTRPAPHTRLSVNKKL